MLIPQAVVQQTTGMVLLEDQLLGSAGTFDFQNISQQYKHLRLEFHVRATQGSAVSVRLQFNNDTGANYQTQIYQANNVTNTPSQEIGQTSARCGSAPATASGWVGSGVVDVMNYTSSTFRKTFVAAGGRVDATGSAGTIYEGDYGAWDSTAAVTRITISPSAGTTFVTGSRATLYALN